MASPVCPGSVCLSSAETGRYPADTGQHGNTRREMLVQPERNRARETAQLVKYLLYRTRVRTQVWIHSTHINAKQFWQAAYNPANGRQTQGNPCSKLAS